MLKKVYLQFTIHRSRFTKAIAFTLAETLIVMGIIGVVAALTLPNLNSSTGEKEKVAKLQKIYQNLSDASGRVQAVYGPVTEWGTLGIGSRVFSDRMEDFLKISKKCTSDSRTNDCFVKTENCLSGDSCKRGITGDCWSMDKGSYILADGSSIFVFTGCSSGGDNGIGFFVDIDGPNKGSNTWGKDIFAFQIPYGSTELIPDERSFKPIDSDNDLKNNCFISGASCATWVIQNGNMDYLKVGSDGKCNNSNTVLDWTTNTSCK